MGKPMKYLDEFRDVVAARRLIDKIRETVTRSWMLMDVCGGQTHSLVRNGIEQELAGHVELIHGPGCPVCVTSTELIDEAVALSQRPQTVVASFGDMIRVPGSTVSLMQARGRGGHLQMVYSPLDAVAFAQRSPDQEVVFFAVGFETTAPATALAVRQAAELGIKNFSIIPAHVRVLPAMEAIMVMPETRVEGFLAAGHVCSITGFESYDRFVAKHHVPVVVTGFEPIDLLEGILRCITRLEQSQPTVENCYGRGVRRDGNAAARALIDSVYQIDDRDWRGFGTITGGGYRLRDEFASFDARIRFQYQPVSQVKPAVELTPVDRVDRTDGVALQCRGAEVMSGKIKPQQCAAFGTCCTPESPLGAPMVSSEGACAAYYRFDPVRRESPS